MKSADDPDRYSDDETAKRRDDVIRRMINTPPQPHAAPVRKPKDRPAPKGRVRKGKARQ